MEKSEPLVEAARKRGVELAPPALRVMSDDDATVAELQSAIATAAQAAHGDPSDFAYAAIDAMAKARPEVEVEVQAIQIGPVVLVSNPSEYFVQYGLDIKKGSKFPFTFPVELANGCTGYVPTEEAFGPQGGGYETRLTSYSNLEISAGRQFAEIGIALANEMTPGARIEGVEGAGHSIQGDRPLELTALIEDFIFGGD